MSTTVTEPARDRPGGTTRPGLSTPKQTVTSARTASPATLPVSESTPLGTSTATTGIPAPSTARTALAAGSRRAPTPPIPRIPSRTRSAPATSWSTSGSAHASTRTPAARAAAVPATCIRAGSPTATPRTPRRARCARAHNASPPLFPEPTRATTRDPSMPARRPRRRSAQIPARAVEARCMRTGSGTPAPASARRTTSTEQIGRISTSAPPAYHMDTTHTQRTTRTIHPTRHIGNVRPGPTRDRVGGRRIPPPPILPQPGRERGTQVSGYPTGPPARRNPRGPGSTRRTTGWGLLRTNQCARDPTAHLAGDEGHTMNRTVGSTLLSAALVCGLGLPAHAVGVPGTDPAEGAQGAPVQALAAPTPTAAAKLRPALGTGTRSPAVVYVQTTLGVKPASGYYGPQTTKAVRALQKRHGLKVTGRVTARTWKVLLRTSSPTTDPAPTPGDPPSTPAAPALTPQQAATTKPALGPDSRGPAVVFVQEKLGVTPATGYFGPLTAAAVRTLQEVNDLKITGKVGPATWKILLAAEGVIELPLASDTPTTTPQAGADAQPAPPPAPPAPAALTPEQAAAARPLLSSGVRPRRPGRHLRAAVPAGVAGHRLLRPVDDQGGQGLPGRAGTTGHRHRRCRHLGGRPDRATTTLPGTPDDAHALEAGGPDHPHTHLRAAGEPDRSGPGSRVRTGPGRQALRPRRQRPCGLRLLRVWSSRPT